MMTAVQEIGMVEMDALQLIDGVTDQEFCAAAAVVETTFLSKQAGFIRRQLLREPHCWTVITCWESAEDCTRASRLAPADPAVQYLQTLLKDQPGKRAGDWTKFANN